MKSLRVAFYPRRPPAVWIRETDPEVSLEAVRREAVEILAGPGELPDWVKVPAGYRADAIRILARLPRGTVPTHPVWSAVRLDVGADGVTWSPSR